MPRGRRQPPTHGRWGRGRAGCSGITGGRGLEDALEWDAARWDAAGRGCGEPLFPVMLGHFWTLGGSHTSVNPQAALRGPRWHVPPCPSIPDTLRDRVPLSLLSAADAQVARERHREPRHQPGYCSAGAVVPTWAPIPCGGRMERPCARSRGCVTWVNCTSPPQQSLSQALTLVSSG